MFSVNHSQPMNRASLCCIYHIGQTCYVEAGHSMKSRVI